MANEEKKEHRDEKFSNILKADVMFHEDGIRQWNKGDELHDLTEDDYHRLGHQQAAQGLPAALYTHEEIEEQEASAKKQEEARQKELEELEKATDEQLKERDKALEESAKQSSKKSSKKSEE